MKWLVSVSTRDSNGEASQPVSAWLSQDDAFTHARTRSSQATAVMVAPWSDDDYFAAFGTLLGRFPYER